MADEIVTRVVSPFLTNRDVVNVSLLNREHRQAMAEVLERRRQDPEVRARLYYREMIDAGRSEDEARVGAHRYKINLSRGEDVARYEGRLAIEELRQHNREGEEAVDDIYSTASDEGPPSDSNESGLDTDSDF